MKRIPIEERKVSTTIALTPATLSTLETMCDRMNLSRSSVTEQAIGLFYRYFLVYGPDRADWEDDDPQPPEIPDDVSEIGYNPYTGSYEEDL